MERTVETVVLMNHDLKNQRQSARNRQAIGIKELTLAITLKVPDGHRDGGTTSAAYDEYRTGLDSACADIVVTTTLPSGEHAVVASKRSKNKCFGGYWWMQGGAIHAYRSILDFVAERAEKECGVKPNVEGLIGIFRTCAEDIHASTTNLCYVGFVPYEKLVEARQDKDHSDQKLLTLSDLGLLLKEELHWYPNLAFELVLTTMPD